MSEEERKPSLHEWVHEAKKTHSDEAIITKLKATGWSDEIIAMVMKPLPQSLKVIPPPVVTELVMDPNALSTASATILDITPKYADITLTAKNNTIDLGDAVVKVVLEMKVPRVVIVDDFLSPEECDELITLSEPSLHRSTVVESGTGGSVVDDIRTSAGMFHSRGGSPLVTKIEERISKLIEWPVENGEGMQILMYDKDEKYEPHNDYFNPNDPGSVHTLGTAGQRVASVLIYLNSPAAGGSTSFPDVGMEVKPRKGTLLFFAYPLPDYRSKTLHGGMPVVDGVKWAAVKWYRRNKF